MCECGEFRAGISRSRDRPPIIGPTRCTGDKRTLSVAITEDVGAKLGVLPESEVRSSII
jgi:hypothetical protein